MTKSGYSYLCSAGEMFDAIALKVYGDEKYAYALMNANPKYAETVIFEGNEELILPIIETEETEAYAATTAPWKE